MRIYLRLAWRNIWRHRSRTLIVVLAIGLTMMLMMAYDGMLAGFERSLASNAVRVMGGNIQVHGEGYRATADSMPLLALADDGRVVAAAEAHPQVVTASRRINTNGLASNREGAFPVNIIGIEPDKEILVNLAAQNVVSGRYLTAEDQDMIFIGQGLADAMDIAVGDRITLAGRATHKQMRNRTMTVVGVYDLGMKEIEKRILYISLGEAQELYGLSGKATEVSISLKQLGQEPAVIAALEQELPGYEVDSWEVTYPEMSQALSTKNWVMDLFSVFILVIAGIGILNLLLMAVYERTREIGVLGALGFKPRQISLVFLLEGAMMGLVGLAFGVGLGLLFNGVFGLVGFDYSQFAGLTEYTALIEGRIHSTLGLEKLLLRGLTVVVISLLAAYYPAHEAANHEPAQALHYV